MERLFQYGYHVHNEIVTRSWLVLHGIDYTHIGLKNTMSGRDTYMDIYEGVTAYYRPSQR
jgi:hypothetical protein